MANSVPGSTGEGCDREEDDVGAVGNRGEELLEVFEDSDLAGGAGAGALGARRRL